MICGQICTESAKSSCTCQIYCKYIRCKWSVASVAKWGILHVIFRCNRKSHRMTFCSPFPVCIIYSISPKNSRFHNPRKTVDLIAEDTLDTKALRAPWLPADSLSPLLALACKQPCGTARSYNLQSASHTHTHTWKAEKGTCVGLSNTWRVYMVKWSTEEDLYALPPLRNWWTASITISSQSIGWLNSVWN